MAITKQKAGAGTVVYGAQYGGNDTIDSNNASSASDKTSDTLQENATGEGSSSAFAEHIRELFKRNPSD